MPDDTTIRDYLIETQVDIFRIAKHDLQLPLKAIAADAKIPISTVIALSQGRNPLSMEQLKRLLRIPKLRPQLSRLFEPEEVQFAPLLEYIDEDAVAEACQDYLAENLAAHRADSELGPAFGPGEKKRLARKRAKLKAVA